MTTETHVCPGGCGRQIQQGMLACAYHWRLVPGETQREVYRTYRARLRAPRDREAIAAHQAAMRRAVAAMAAQGAQR